ncbi:MAG: hypothetical protein R3240_08840 [Gammaproteobacteria bacterium]|nr:hypothetical protein [Gammaproteobacteria bacterium]
MFKLIFLILISIAIGAFYVGGVKLTNAEIGNLFIAGIVSTFVLFLLFKFGLHYKIRALNNYCMAFYYSVFEYKKKSQQSLRAINFSNSVLEQAEVAMSANFDPKVAQLAMKVPVSMYTKDSAYMPVLRARIQEAERLKLKAKDLEGKASKLIEETEGILEDKKIKEKSKKGSFFESLFGIQEGVQKMTELTVSELKDQDYSIAPDYDIITHIALDNNPYFSTVYKSFSMDNVAAILNRAPFMIILMGIIGTFAGFFLALSEGGDIKAGAAVAIVSSLVGLPISLAIDYINTLYPDAERYQNAFNRYKLSLEILFNHEKDRYPNRGGRRKEDKAAYNEEPSDFDSTISEFDDD